MFRVARANGQRFARSTDGLQPALVGGWKAPTSHPYEQIPADLRVDHVYLLSCKYGSKTQNASPANPSISAQ